MDEYFRLKTIRSKHRQPHNGKPQRGEKRKQWERTTHKRSQGE